MYILLLFIVFVIAVILIFPLQVKFGKAPKGKRLELMATKPNFKNGVFENLVHTPSLAEDATLLTVLKTFLNKTPHSTPNYKLEVVQTDLKSLATDQNILIWFGHSSYYLQIDSKRILVDPVFSNNASPLPNSIKAFPGTDSYAIEDFPNIDYLLITHDHWDHLDYPTVVKLKNKVDKVITGLGVGSHFEAWGYDASQVTELYWQEHIDLGPIRLTAAPTRHFSGRSLHRNNTLWVSFILQSSTLNLYLGGDSGYGPHFKEIGEHFGPFDLAILDNGQYNKAWKYIHMSPQEVIKAATDLGADCTLPVHSGKFKLSDHAWDEPLHEVSRIAQKENKKIITPRIGEVVYLDDTEQLFQKWWLNAH